MRQPCMRRSVRVSIDPLTRAVLGGLACLAALSGCGAPPSWEAVVEVSLDSLEQRYGSPIRVDVRQLNASLDGGWDPDEIDLTMSTQREEWLKAMGYESTDLAVHRGCLEMHLALPMWVPEECLGPGGGTHVVFSSPKRESSRWRVRVVVLQRHSIRNLELYLQRDGGWRITEISEGEPAVLPSCC